jgi:hypothetical protein
MPAPRVLERRFSALVGIVVQRADARQACAVEICKHSALIFGLGTDVLLMLIARGPLAEVLPRLSAHPWNQLLLVTNRYVGLTRPVLDAALWALYGAHIGAWRVQPLPAGYEPDEQARAGARDVLDAVVFFHMQLGGSPRSSSR